MSDNAATEGNHAKNRDEELRDEHLRYHLYDGRWHDDCTYCHHRRVHGGTGIYVDVPVHSAHSRAYPKTPIQVEVA